MLFSLDPQLSFGSIKKRAKRDYESGIEAPDASFDEDVSEDEMSDLSGNDMEGSVSEDDNDSEISEDDGVFDVDRNSLSSFTGSQNSTTFPQPRTGLVEAMEYENNSDLDDDQIGTDENVSEVSYCLISIFQLSL